MSYEYAGLESVSAEACARASAFGVNFEKHEMRSSSLEDIYAALANDIRGDENRRINFQRFVQEHLVSGAIGKIPS